MEYCSYYHYYPSHFPIQLFLMTYEREKIVVTKFTSFRKLLSLHSTRPSNLPRTSLSPLDEKKMSLIVLSYWVDLLARKQILGHEVNFIAQFVLLSTEPNSAMETTKSMSLTRKIQCFPAILRHLLSSMTRLFCLPLASVMALTKLQTVPTLDNKRTIAWFDCGHKNQ
mgnify:FL=1